MFFVIVLLWTLFEQSYLPSILLSVSVCSLLLVSVFSLLFTCVFLLLLVSVFSLIFAFVILPLFVCVVSSLFLCSVLMCQPFFFVACSSIQCGAFRFCWCCFCLRCCCCWWYFSVSAVRFGDHFTPSIRAFSEISVLRREVRVVQWAIGKNRAEIYGWIVDECIVLMAWKEAVLQSASMIVWFGNKSEM